MINICSALQLTQKNVKQVRTDKGTTLDELDQMEIL